MVAALLEFSTNHFETTCTCSASSVNVHMVFGLSSLFFFINFFYFFNLVFFPVSISIIIGTLWAQLLLEVSTHHFETMHTFFYIV